MTLLPPPLFFPLRRIERYRRAKHYGKEGRETTMFLHALPYHVENFSFLSGSEHPDYIQSRRFPAFFFFFFCPSDSGDLLERNAGKKYISCAYFSTRAAHKKTRCIFSWSNGSFPRRARRRPDPPKIRESPPWKASSRVWGQARLNERHEAYRGRGTQPSLRRK